MWCECVDDVMECVFDYHVWLRKLCVFVCLYALGVVIGGGGEWVLVYCMVSVCVHMGVCGRGVCVCVCVGRKGLLRV